MSRRRKLRILIPVVIILFLGAYAKHKLIDGKYIISGSLQSRDAREVSGLAASILNPDVYYVQNDSGDTSRFFAITPYGKTISTITYNWGPNNDIYAHDCEDIAVGPGPFKSKSYIYIADIGDNAAQRPWVNIYRIRERKKLLAGLETNAYATPLHLKYPDGPKDAETLMIDSVEKLIYIISKRRDSVGVYTAPLAYKKDDTVTMTKRGNLFFKGIKPFKWITGGDISADGQRVLLKSYQKVYYWHRKDNEPIWQTLQRKPSEPAYQQEKLGEAIGFTPDGSGYYTTSEGVFSPIHYYKTPGYFGL